MLQLYSDTQFLIKSLHNTSSVVRLYTPRPNVCSMRVRSYLFWFAGNCCIRLTILWITVDINFDWMQYCSNNLMCSSVRLNIVLNVSYNCNRSFFLKLLIPAANDMLWPVTNTSPPPFHIHVQLFADDFRLFQESKIIGKQLWSFWKVI